MRRRWRWQRAIISVAMAAIVMAAVVVTVTVMAGRHDGLHAGLPDHRGRHVGLTGSGHGPIGIAAPLVAIGVNLRGHKKGAVVLLLWRAWRHYRSDDVTGLRVTVLGSNTPVVEGVTRQLARTVGYVPLPAIARRSGVR